MFVWKWNLELWMFWIFPFLGSFLSLFATHPAYVMSCIFHTFLKSESDSLFFRFLLLGLSTHCWELISAFAQFCESESSVISEKRKSPPSWPLFHAGSSTWLMYNFVRVKVCESLWYQKSESFSQLSPGYLPSQLSAHPALCYASVICVLNVKVLKYPPSWSSPLAPAYHISVICFCDIRKVKVEVSFPLLGHIPSLLAAHPVCMYDFKKVKVLWYIIKSESFQIPPF